MAHIMSKAEKLVLEEIYPAGSRVELEYMEAGRTEELKPGDRGTVNAIGDDGGIDIAWDCGSSLALVYREDVCRCLMTKKQMDDFINMLLLIPVESNKKLEAWLEKKLKPVFPEMRFAKGEDGEMKVDLCADAFQMKKPRINIRYRIDGKGHLFIQKSGWGEKNYGRRVENKRPEYKR